MRVAAILTVSEHSPGKGYPALEGIKVQRGLSDIWIWDNGRPRDRGTFGRGCYQIEARCGASAVNLGLATHQLAGLIDADWILKVDDDVQLEDPGFLEAGLGALSRHGADIAGIMGRVIPEIPPFYAGRQAITHPEEDALVDLVIGKLMLYRRDILRGVSVVSDGSTVEDLQLNRASRKPGLIPACWASGWRDLDKPKGASLSDSPTHYQRRENYVREHFHELQKLD